MHELAPAPADCPAHPGPAALLDGLTEAVGASAPGLTAFAHLTLRAGRTHWHVRSPASADSFPLAPADLPRSAALCPPRAEPFVLARAGEAVAGLRIVVEGPGGVGHLGALHPTRALAPAEERSVAACLDQLAPILRALLLAPPCGGGDGPRLTSRQQELLTLLAQGHTNARVAARMGVAPSAVKTMLERLYYRFNVRGRVELLRVVNRRPCDAMPPRRAVPR